MNKNDKKLVFFVLLFSCSLWLIFSLKKQDYSVATVYYQDKIIKQIDLSINNTYQVEGELGKVKIVVKNKQIKVEEENSPRHLCSKQGFISSYNEAIICLPNKIVIQIENNKLDTVIG